MENEIVAHRDGVVRDLAVAAGERDRERAGRLSRRGRMSADGRRRARPRPDRARDAHRRDAEQAAPLRSGQGEQDHRRSRARRPRAPLPLAPPHGNARRRTRTSLPEETERRLVHLIGGEFRQALLRAHRRRSPGARRRDGARPSCAARQPPARDVDARPAQAPAARGRNAGAVSRRARRDDPRRDASRRSAIAKFRQVNRFLELVDDVLPALPAGAACGSSTSAPASRTSRSRCITCSPSCGGGRSTSSGSISRRTSSRRARRSRAGSAPRALASRSATSPATAATRPISWSRSTPATPRPTRRSSEPSAGRRR